VQVSWVNLPKPGQGPLINGADDLLAAWGPERVLDLFQQSEPAPAHEPEPSQARQLIELCDEIELFRTLDCEAYALIPVAEHRETWMLGSGAFSRWLSRQFHQSRGKPPRAQALQEALGLLEAKAQFESPEIPVWVRVAEHGGLIYIDLCNSAWEVVEIGELYTDSDEIIFDAMRPVTLNGIDHLAERADLAERALILHLPRIAPNDRQDERSFTRTLSANCL
jgi:hypothetical protein